MSEVLQSYHYVFTVDVLHLNLREYLVMKLFAYLVKEIPKGSILRTEKIFLEEGGLLAIVWVDFEAVEVCLELRYSPQGVFMGEITMEDHVFSIQHVMLV